MLRFILAPISLEAAIAAVQIDDRFPSKRASISTKITSGWRIKWTRNLARYNAVAVRTASCQQMQQLLKSEHAIIGTPAQERPGISAALD